MENNTFEKANTTCTADIVDFDYDAYPVLTCTNRLRWKRQPSEFVNGLPVSSYELQQLWECTNGKTEWRNVEFVN